MQPNYDPRYPAPVQRPVCPPPQASVYMPPYPIQAYAPRFTVKQKRPPRLQGAGRDFNIMCLLVLCQTAVAFLLGMVVVTPLTLLGVDLTEGMAYQWFNAAAVPLSTALPFVVYLFLSKQGAANCLRFSHVGFGTAALCVLGGLSIILLGNYPSFVIQDFFGNFGYQPAGDMTSGQDSWQMFVLEMFSTAILVPVMEELAFRGVLFSALRKHGAGFAIIGSAMVFALVHLDFSGVVFAFIAGLVFAFLYERTGNLWVTIAIHALNNGLAVMNSYGVFLFGDAKTADLISNLTMGVPILLGLIALAVMSVMKNPLLYDQERRSPWEPIPQENAPALTAGESAGSIVRAPLFWVVVAFMVLYTISLFFS